MAITSSGYNTNRLTGMYSGMDTASLITSMLATHQSRYDKTFQQKEKAQWKHDAYTSLNSTVSTLRSDYLSVLGSKTVMSSKAYNKFTVNMESNAALKLTAMETASNTSFTVLSTQMAKAASVSSSLNSRQTQASGAAGKYMQAQVTGELTLPEGTTAQEAPNMSLEELNLLDENGKLSFTINGETFSFEKQVTEGESTRPTTLQDVIDEVNDTKNLAGGSKEAGVEMSLKNGALTIKSNTVGADSKLEISNVSGKLFGAGNVLSDKATMVDTLDTSTATFADGITDTTFSINGTEFDLLKADGTAKTMDEVMQEVNDSGIGVQFGYDNGAFSIRNTPERGSTAIQLEGEIFGADSKTGIDAGQHSTTESIKRSDTIAQAVSKLGGQLDGDTLNIKINGKEFSFNSTDKLSDMMSKIESSDVGAKFSFSEMTDSFKLESSETGADSTLSVEGLEVFGLADGEYSNGSNAVLEFRKDGEEYSISQESNSFTLDGMTFEITSDKVFEGGGLAVSVEQDYQATVDAVKGFIDDYNKMIEELNGKYYEDTYRTYQPLTNDQRSEMTEKEAELWDEKAKSGILKNDNIIGSLLTNLRAGIYAEVGDTGMSAFDIGIKTVGWSSDWKSSQGKLELDEEKFLAALKKDPDAVANVLTQVSTTSDGKADASISGTGASTKTESGLFTRMNSLLSDFNTTMRSQFSILQTNMSSYTSKMDEILDEMSEREEKLYAQFAAMETALADLQSQMGYFSGLTGTTTQQ